MTENLSDFLTALLAAETAVWQALVDGDAAADTALLHRDFLGVYPSGFANRADHADQLEAGPSIASFTLTEARCLTLGPELGMLSYHPRYRRPGGPEEAMYISSLWRRESGVWLNLFSQDTPIP